MARKPFTVPSGWRRVVFAAECEPYGFCPVCRAAGEEIDYADCPCPGPTQMEEYHYAEIQGVLCARPRKTAPLPAEPRQATRKKQTGDKT